MVYISDATIDRLIKEDVPYIDLTTMVLGIGKRQGRLIFSAREDAVLACSEEAMRVFQKLNISPVKHLSSGSIIKPGETILEGTGSVESLHIAWKVCLNILEYCSGIATRTKHLVEKSEKNNLGVSIVTTRKGFPGTKELAIKSVIAGGAYPHRLGLSETILVFEQHLNFIGGISGFIKIFNKVKEKACEKKIIVEVKELEDALLLAEVGVDGIQLDKVPADILPEYVKQIRLINPRVLIIGTGGIHSENIEQYALTGINAIATSSVYYGKPVDIKASIIH